MSWSSLRLRLIVGGGVAILVALIVAGIGLTVLFERHAARTMADDLEFHLKRLLAAVDIDAEGRLSVARPPVDPRFAEPLSGLYWQVGDDRNEFIRSRSLWDTTLPLPSDDPAQGQVHHHELPGPAGTRVLIAERRITLTSGGREIPVRVAVAVDLARIRAAGISFATDLVYALGFLGLILALTMSIQIGLGLRPLDAIRRSIAGIRSGSTTRLPAEVPIEVRPLVDEVNALLAAQEKALERSRGRAADLAHALKTPLAALVGDAARLREKGEVQIASDIEAVSQAMRRHVDRELARARVRATDSLRRSIAMPVLPLLRSLIATLSRTADGGRLDYDTVVAADVTAPFDRADLAEVLGNLLENATRHAKSRVRVSAHALADGVEINVEDDGPGIAPAERPGVLARGVRLDERGEGAGLGLAIVQDVLEAYGWTLRLGASDLGGLKASIGAAPRVTA